MRESMRRLAADDADQKAGNIRRVRVELLDGDYITVELDRKCRGEHLLDKICESLDVVEWDYFGMLHAQRGDARVWVDLDRRLAKTFKNEPWEVAFAVKFYPPEPSELRDENARYQVTLAVRKDIAEGRLTCSALTSALLASYVLQAEAGDWSPCPPGAPAPSPLAPLLSRLRAAPRAALAPDWEDNTIRLYRKHKGQTPAEAELNYLENAKRLPLYGAEVHTVQDNEGREIALAVCASGVSVYRAGVQMHRFPWAKITKLSYKKRMFSVTLRPTQFEEYETALTFRLASTRAASALWRSAVQHHMFFRREVPVPVPRGLGVWSRRVSCRRTLRQLREQYSHGV